LAEVEIEHVFKGTPKQVFSALRRYDLYPKFLPGVQKVEILPAMVKGATAQVRYELNLIKTFYYVLNMRETPCESIAWDMADSNLMKANAGSWALKPKGKSQTAATYRLDVQFRGLVPSMVTDRIAAANLPAMMTGFQRLIDAVKAEP
jgi:ribosome-associated toxin RatA of RatAB toxin-antitoxin module